MTKSVRSVWSSATARMSRAFSSARIRNDIRLLSSTATRGMLRSPICTHSNSTKDQHESQLLRCAENLQRATGHRGLQDELALERVESPHVELLEVPFIPSRHNQTMDPCCRGDHGVL